MSYKEKLNRFSELTQALEQMSQSTHVQQSLRPVAETAGQRSLAELRQAAPVGKLEPNYEAVRSDGSTYTISHGRPSLRLHGSSLASNWGAPEIQTQDNGVSFTILSNAPHMGLLLAGSPAHPIQKQSEQPLSFYSFSQNTPIIYGLFTEATINHPGFSPSTFVEDTLARGLRNETRQLLTRGVDNIRKPLTQFFR